MRKKWIAYEGAARKVIADMREVLAIATAGGKQRAEGASGMQWELDASTWQEGADSFLLIEVQQFSSPLNQQALACMLWHMANVGDSGCMVASLLPQQKSLKPVSKTGNSEYLRLTDDSTAENYIAEFLSRRFHNPSVTDGL